MLFPNVLARIEKRRENPGFRIITCDVGAFGGIAMGAGKTGILYRVWAMMFRCANVVDLVRQDTVFLGQLAVLAAPTCSLLDQTTANLGHRSPRLRFFQGLPRLRLKYIDELAHPNVLLQDNPFLGRDYATLILV